VSGGTQDWDGARYDRLERAGFSSARARTPEVTPSPAGAPLADFPETVCLREYLASLPPAERRPFAERVAAAMPEPVIDYVRLSIVARR
jgi:trans-aconitate 2-methyltransferase